MHHYLELTQHKEGLALVSGYSTICPSGMAARELALYILIRHCPHRALSKNHCSPGFGYAALAMAEVAGVVASVYTLAGVVSDLRKSITLLRGCWNGEVPADMEILIRQVDLRRNLIEKMELRLSQAVRPQSTGWVIAS
jgi:hypothetical protein